MTIKLLGILKSDKRSMSVCLLRIMFGTRFFVFAVAAAAAVAAADVQIRVNHRYTIIPPCCAVMWKCIRWPISNIAHTPLSLNKRQSMLKYSRTLSIICISKGEIVYFVMQACACVFFIQFFSSIFSTLKLVWFKHHLIIANSTRQNRIPASSVNNFHKVISYTMYYNNAIMLF